MAARMAQAKAAAGGGSGQNSGYWDAVESMSDTERRDFEAKQQGLTADLMDKGFSSKEASDIIMDAVKTLKAAGEPLSRLPMDSFQLGERMGEVIEKVKGNYDVGEEAGETFASGLIGESGTPAGQAAGVVGGVAAQAVAPVVEGVLGFGEAMKKFLSGMGNFKATGKGRTSARGPSGAAGMFGGRGQ